MKVNYEQFLFVRKTGDFEYKGITVFAVISN